MSGVTLNEYNYPSRVKNENELHGEREKKVLRRLNYRFDMETEIMSWTICNYVYNMQICVQYATMCTICNCVYNMQ